MKHGYTVLAEKCKEIISYQTKQFACKKCGINFEVSKDTTIEPQKYCNECRMNADNYKRRNE